MKVIKHSHILPGSDASILACLAQSAASLTDVETQAMIEELSCSCTQQMARDILARNINNPAAKAFLDWVDTLSKRNT